MRLRRLDHKRHCSVLKTLSWIARSAGNCPPCCEDTQAALWRGSMQKNWGLLPTATWSHLRWGSSSPSPSRAFRGLRPSPTSRPWDRIIQPSSSQTLTHRLYVWRNKCLLFDATEFWHNWLHGSRQLTVIFSTLSGLWDVKYFIIKIQSKRPELGPHWLMVRNSG